MREINAEMLKEQEKTLEELVVKNKGFFELFKSEELSRKLRKELKDNQSFGNKDTQFKKSLVDKWNDQRIAKLKGDWLRDKKVLDIGCGTGILDIMLAVRHQPRLIIAVDIDCNLVKTAIDNMQKVINDSE